MTEIPREYEEQWKKPFEEWQTAPAETDPILFRTSPRMAMIGGLPNMVNVTAFVFAAKREWWSRFGVGLHWRNPSATEAVCAVTVEVDDRTADYLTCWRTIQVLSTCQNFDLDFCMAALDFIQGREFGEREVDQIVNDYNASIATGQELSRLERLHLALGRPADVERVYREALSLEPTPEEKDRADKLLQEYNIIITPETIIDRSPDPFKDLLEFEDL